MKRYSIDHKGLPLFDDEGVWVSFTDAQAAIAAAMQGAIAELIAFRGPVDVPRTDKAVIQDDAIDRCITILKEHVPSDATAALEAMRQQARDDALEEAAKVQDAQANWWCQEVDKRSAKSNSEPKMFAVVSGRFAGHFAAATAIRAMKGKQ